MDNSPIVVPGQSIILAYIHPKKMDKRLLRSFMFDKEIFHPLFEKHFNKSLLRGRFAIEDIYDCFHRSEEGKVERLMMNLIADKYLTDNQLEMFTPMAIETFYTFIQELLDALPGEFDPTTYRNLMAT